jgi:ribosome recycling factor
MSDAAQLKDKGKKTVEAFKRELGKMRTGRASASLLEGIKAEYYGTMTPLNQMGNISTPEPRIIAIQAYDKGAVEAIMKAIRASELGLNPSNEGQTIRVILPALTEDRRKELIKKLKDVGEEHRVFIRNHRREAIDSVKAAVKNKTMSEDDSKRSQDELQKITDGLIKEIDVLLTAKEKEMMEV